MCEPYIHRLTAGSLSPFHHTAMQPRAHSSQLVKFKNNSKLTAENAAKFHCLSLAVVELEIKRL